MGNSKSKFSRACYFITVISIILIIAILSNYFHDIKETSQEMKREMQINNAQIISDYMKEFFKEREAALSLIGTYLSDININNKKNLKGILPLYEDLFDNIALIGTDGSLIYGNPGTGDVKDEDGFKKALGGQGMTATELTESYDGKRELRLYTPAMDKRGEVKAVLTASFLDSTLSSYIEGKVSGSDACAVVLNSQGRVMYGSSNTEDFIGKAETSYFSFIKTCDITTKRLHPDDILESIRGQKEIFAEYKYTGQNYISACVPAGINGFYIIYISKGKKSGIERGILSKSNIVLLRILIADMALVSGLLCYSIKSRSKVADLLDKYEIVDKQDGAILFEYTFQPKEFKVYGDCEKIFGKKFHTLTGEAVYDVYNLVHKEDASVRGRVHEFFDSKQDVFSSEIRLLHTNGEYGWFRITGTISRNEIGQCIRFIGKLVNANKQISMEKNLVKRAENDLLTGVLNKKTIEAKITESLKNEHYGRNYIFYMVDLDNFKNVNDTLGHIFGDKAIADTANVLTGIFHDNAYVGRLGGDEFAVCAIYDAFDEESLINFTIDHAEKICKANRREYSDGVNTVKISSSVGIAIGPKDGQTFEMLYKKADECLYKSKKAGKNKYTIFDYYTVFNR